MQQGRREGGKEGKGINVENDRVTILDKLGREVFAERGYLRKYMKDESE